MKTHESRTERFTLRFPKDMKAMLEARAYGNCRSLSAEVRELLTYARNTVSEEDLPPIQEWRKAKSTSICLTPGLKNWLYARAQYEDRTAQATLMAMLTYAVDSIMERDLALIEQWLPPDPAAQMPG